MKKIEKIENTKKWNKLKNHDYIQLRGFVRKCRKCIVEYVEIH